MDISSDSKLLVSCSADKNVKIWGLDFGDCHRSIFAHDESVMQVAFEKHDSREMDAKPSHYFWTVGKDKMLKYWDGDKVRVCVRKTFTVCAYPACSLKISKSWMAITVRYGRSQ